MSIEKLLEENTAAATRLADLLEAQGGTAAKPAAGKPAAGKPAAGKPKATFEDVKTAVMAVKDTIDEAAAKAILVKHGGAGAKLATIQNLPDKWAAVLKSAETALDAHESAEDEPADDDDGI